MYPKVLLSFDLACLKFKPLVSIVPPVNSRVEPGESIALLVKKCTTPDVTLGPYIAEFAPLTTSILAISIFDIPVPYEKNEPAAGVTR